jgi:hypothetical protein
MKKTNLIIITVIIAILLLAGWFLIFNKKDPGSGQQAAVTGDQSKPGVKEGLLGLLEGATGIKCAVEDANGKYTVTAKGGKARIDGMNFPNPKNPAVSEAGSMINDGEWAYIWNGKEGMKFNLKDASETSGQPQDAQENNYDWKNWAKSMETSGAKYDCNPAVATDADFTPPSDVKFQDLGELLKGFQQMQNNSGVPVDPKQFNLP